MRRRGKDRKEYGKKEKKEDGSDGATVTADASDSSERDALKNLTVGDADAPKRSRAKDVKQVNVIYPSCYHN